MKDLGILCGKLGFNVETQQHKNDSIFLCVKCIMDATFLLGCFQKTENTDFVTQLSLLPPLFSSLFTPQHTSAWE